MGNCDFSLMWIHVEWLTFNQLIVKKLCTGDMFVCLSHWIFGDEYNRKPPIKKGLKDGICSRY